MRQATAKAQRTTDAVSSLQTAVNDLTAPINSIHSQLPSLQNSVTAFIPQIIPQLELIIQSQLRAQTEEIRKSLQEVESTAVQRHNTTSTILSQLVTPDDNQATVVRKLASKPSTLAELTSTLFTCFCHARRSNTSKTFRFSSLYLRENVVTDMPHKVGCDFYVANVTPSRTQTVSFTGIVRLLKSAIQLSICTTTGAGGYSISPNLTYFQVVDDSTAPAFQVLSSLRPFQFFTFVPSKKQLDVYFEAMLEKLQELFGSGKAKPTDVSEHGSSLLHELAMNVSKRLRRERHRMLIWIIDSNAELVLQRLATGAFS